MNPQIPMQLGSLPVTIVFIINNGQPFVGVQPQGNFLPIFDPEYDVVVSTEKIVVKGKDVAYNHGYRLEGDLKEWVKSFNLTNPVEEMYV